MGIEQRQDRTPLSLEGLRAVYKERSLPLTDSFNISEEEVGTAIDIAFSLAESRFSQPTLEVFAEFFRDCSDCKSLPVANGVVTILCALIRDLGERGYFQESQQAKNSLLLIGENLREQARQDLEVGVQSLVFINLPLMQPGERKIRATFRNIFTDLQRAADTDERRFWLATMVQRALKEEIPNWLEDSLERRQLKDTTQGSMVRLLRKIYFFDPARDKLTPEVLNLLLGAIYYGEKVGYTPHSGLTKVVGIEEVDLEKVRRSIDRGETFSVPDLARAKLRQVLEHLSVRDEETLFELAEVLVRSIPMATKKTMGAIGALLVEGDQRLILGGDGERLPSPLGAVLNQMAEEGSPLSQRAEKVLSSAITATLERKFAVESEGVGLGSLLFHSVVRGDFTLKQKEMFLRAFFPALESQLPANWLDLITTIEEVRGDYILVVFNGCPFLFARDERPDRDQVEDINIHLGQGSLPPYLLWRGEYPPVEEQAFVPDKASVLPLPLVGPEGAEVPPSVSELADSPDLEAMERLRRFVKRLKKEEVVKEMTEEEVLEILEETERLWRQITPFVPSNRTNTFSAIGTNFKLSLDVPPVRVRSSQIPRVTLSHGEVLSGRGISDVRANTVIAEDLVLRFAVNRNGELVLADSEDKTTKVFLEDIIRREEVPTFALEQLNSLVVNLAHFALRKSEKVLSDRARGVVERALLTPPSGEKRTRKPRRAKTSQAPGEEGISVVLYDQEAKSPYRDEQKFWQALQEGKIVVERSDLTDEEALRMRQHLRRGGLRKRTPVRGLGQAGGLVWLGFTKDGRPRLPSLDAIRRAESVGVRLRKADVWLIEDGELECYTVYSTFRRAT